VKQVGKTTSYSLLLKLKDQVSKDAEIVITFPTQISIASVSPTSCSISSSPGVSALRTLASCTYDSAARTVKVTELFSDFYAPNDEIITIILTSITNPSTTKPSDALRIETYYDIVNYPTGMVDTSVGLSDTSLKIASSVGFLDDNSITITAVSY
jgi:hypothetical protein